nr:DAR GTPase 2, mitochondrial [Ipomoea batatas]
MPTLPPPSPVAVRTGETIHGLPHLGGPAFTLLGMIGGLYLLRFQLLNMSEALLLQGLGLQVVEDVQEADFILAHGTEAIGLRSRAALPMKLEDLEKILKRCAEI